MIGGGLTGPGSNLLPGEPGIDKLGTGNQNTFDIDPKDLILYARGDRRDSARDPGKAGPKATDQASTQMRKAMDFDAVHGRPSGLDNGGRSQDRDGGDVRLAQASTGTMTDGVPDVAGGRAGTDSTRIRVQNNGQADGGVLGWLGNIAKKGGAKVGGLVTGIIVPTNSNHDQTLTIPGHPQYRITGKESEITQTLEVQNADGSWEPIGTVDIDSGPGGSHIDLAKVNDVLGDRGFEPIGGAVAGKVDKQSKSTVDDDSRAKAPPTTLTESGDRHDDDSCAPEGTDGQWVVVNRAGMSDKAEAYQQQITKTPDLPGKLMVEYEVTDRTTGKSVKMDGCAVWSEDKQLLDAKYASGKSQDLHERAPDVSNAIMRGEEQQAQRQEEVIGRTHSVEWHVSEGSAKPRFERAVRDGTRAAPNFSVVNTPTTNGR